MIQIARKSALANLQQEALEQGATGIVNVVLTLREIRKGTMVSTETSGEEKAG